MPYFRIKLLTVLLGLIHILPSLFLDLRRYAVEGFGNTFGDATNGVTISTNADSIANRILKVLSLERANDSLRHTILTNITIIFPIGALLRIAPLQFFDRHREDVTEIRSICA